MSFFLFVFSLTVFPSETNRVEIISETSLNAWKWTPRWSVEPYPADQVFLFNKLRCACPFLSYKNIYLGMEVGFANRFHFTYFNTYASWGLDDSELWFLLRTTVTIDILTRIALPTGSYRDGLSNGTYGIELYLRKDQLIPRSRVYVGYEWIGTNPDMMNCGDKLHLELEIHDWLEISSYYAFPDKGTYFLLHDSPSLALEISIFRNLRLMKTCSMALLLKQTLFGKDIPISTSISLIISV